MKCLEELACRLAGVSQHTGASCSVRKQGRVMRTILIAAASVVVFSAASEDAPSESDITRCIETIHAIANQVAEIQCSRFVQLASTTKVSHRVDKESATVFAELEFDVKEDLTDLTGNMCAALPLGTPDTVTRGQRIKSKLSMDFKKNEGRWTCNVNSLSAEEKRKN